MLKSRAKMEIYGLPLFVLVSLELTRNNCCLIAHDNESPLYTLSEKKQTEKCYPERQMSTKVAME